MLTDGEAVLGERCCVTVEAKSEKLKYHTDVFGNQITTEIVKLVLKK